MNTLSPGRGATLSIGTMRLAGIVTSTLVVLFLAADAASQMLFIPPIQAAAAEIGFPGSTGLWQAIGAVLLASTVLYALPRTAFIGALLITGYLGGAISAHVRVGEGMLAPTLVSLAIAALAWGGLILRDARVRPLLFPSR